jgi:ribokinase
VVTTKGAGGATTEYRGTAVSVAGHDIPVADTLGAGDAFAAAFLHRWLGGAELRDTLVFANAAAALSTLSHGAQTGLARPDDVLDFIAKTEAALA